MTIPEATKVRATKARATAKKATEVMASKTKASEEKADMIPVNTLSFPAALKIKVVMKAKVATTKPVSALVNTTSSLAAMSITMKDLMGTNMPPSNTRNITSLAALQDTKVEGTENMDMAWEASNYGDFKPSFWCQYDGILMEEARFTQWIDLFFRMLS
jgi:hypothetical protein